MLWDTAGQEEFDAITKAYYRGICSVIDGDAQGAGVDQSDSHTVYNLILVTGGVDF